jgi:hypothetical protein
VVANVYDLDANPGEEFADFFERELRPVATRAGAGILASFVTENSANNYPALPIREGDDVFVWFSRFADETAYERYVAELAESRQWSEASKKLEDSIKGRPDVLKLSPTARSLVR